MHTKNKRKACHFKHSDKKLNLQGALVVPVRKVDEPALCWQPNNNVEDIVVFQTYKLLILIFFMFFFVVIILIIKNIKYSIIYFYNLLIIMENIQFLN